MTRKFAYHWYGIVIGAIVIVLSNYVGGYLLTFLNLNFLGMASPVITSLIIGVIAYTLYTLIRGLELNWLSAFIFCILLAVCQNIVFMVGFFGVTTNLITLAVSGALVSLLWELIFGDRGVYNRLQFKRHFKRGK